MLVDARVSALLAPACPLLRTGPDFGRTARGLGGSFGSQKTPSGANDE